MNVMVLIAILSLIGAPAVADTPEDEALFGQAHQLRRDGKTDEAVALFERLAQGGHKGAINELIPLYVAGGGVPVRPERHMHWLRKAAEGGSVAYQQTLGCRYLNGRFVPKNERKALEWFSRSAANGSAVGMMALHFAYERGWGGEPDPKAAKSWLDKAVALFREENSANLETGKRLLAKKLANPSKYWTDGGMYGETNPFFADDPEYRIGMALSIGVCKRDGSPSAISWFEKSAAKGNAMAHQALSDEYLRLWKEESGKAPEAFLRHLRRAAELGNRSSQYRLGELYLQGRFVERDPAKAARWIHRAARQHYGPAVRDYAEMLWRGDGAPRDRAKALFWLTITVESEMDDAPLVIAQWRKAMRANERNRAERMAKAWREQGLYPDDPHRYWKIEGLPEGWLREIGGDE